MEKTSLRDDLLGIDGVEGAEVQGLPDAPAGLRIRIANGADQEAVGGAIRRVLSAHGLGTDTRLPGESMPAAQSENDGGGIALLTSEAVDAEEEEEEGETALLASESADAEDEDGERMVIDLTDDHGQTPEPIESVSREPLERMQASVTPGSWEQSDEPLVAPVQKRAARLPSRGTDQVLTRIDSVSVEEGLSGVLVTVVATDGSETFQVASSSESGVELAVVKAAARMVNAAAPDPVVVEIEDRRIEGVDIVMVVLNIDGKLVTGSAIVVAGRAFALGRATWAALSV